LLGWRLVSMIRVQARSSRRGTKQGPNVCRDLRLGVRLQELHNGRNVRKLWRTRGWFSHQCGDDVFVGVFPLLRRPPLQTHRLADTLRNVLHDGGVAGGRPLGQNEPLEMLSDIVNVLGARHWVLFFSRRWGFEEEKSRVHAGEGRCAKIENRTEPDARAKNEGEGTERRGGKGKEKGDQKKREEERRRRGKRKENSPPLCLCPCSSV
jgi:hypothetical protein